MQQVYTLMHRQDPPTRGPIVATEIVASTIDSALVANFPKITPTTWSRKEHERAVVSGGYFLDRDDIHPNARGLFGYMMVGLFDMQQVKEISLEVEPGQSARLTLHYLTGVQHNVTETVNRALGFLRHIDQADYS